MCIACIFYVNKLLLLLLLLLLFLIGTYRTAVEREPCAAGSSHSRLYGVRNYTDTDSTMGFFVVWKGGSSITGWVGKCWCEITIVRGFKM